MPNDPRRRMRQNQPIPAPPVSPPPPPQNNTAGPLPRPEPAMRRWPHPVQQLPSREEDPELRYIHCALAYQNQTLADIKALLETIVLNTTPPPEKETEEG